MTFWGARGGASLLKTESDGFFDLCEYFTQPILFCQGSNCAAFPGHGKN